MVSKHGNTGRTEKRKPFGNGNAKGHGRGQARDAVERGVDRSKHAEGFDLEVDAQDIGDADSSSDDEAASGISSHAYATLMKAIAIGDTTTGRSVKRRKLFRGDESSPNKLSTRASVTIDHDRLLDHGKVQATEGLDDRLSEEPDGIEDEAEEEGNDHVVESEDEATEGDPYASHFPSQSDLGIPVQAASSGKWTSSAQNINGWKFVRQHPPESIDNARMLRYKSVTDLRLKQRLREPANMISPGKSPESLQVSSSIFNYQSMLHGSRTVANATQLRDLSALHILNHILKGRDHVLRNNEKLAKAGENPPDDLDVRDQGFTRPKVLVLLETREACFRWVNSLLRLFEPDQKENWTRFVESFHAEDEQPEHMPEDYRELFSGNTDNDFRIGLKFTRKAVKFFAAFYSSDVLLCSPLGLRRIIAASDPKKRDHDFLSSIEILIIDQADAMLQQNWSHVTYVISHCNQTPRDSHGADFNRVKPFYLDGHAQYLRQTLIFSAYLTPELNSLFSSTQNLAGRVKVSPHHPGAISKPLPVPIKQSFLRYHSPTPPTDPDSRFTFFTATLVPWLVKLCSLSSPTSPAGILIFIPSYLDFVRLRNHFAAAPTLETVRFGLVSEYSSVSEQRRARSHFLIDRNQVLLYSGRAHHFHRYRLRGVRKVVWYGLPDNQAFWDEVNGSIADTVAEGKMRVEEGQVRAMFSRWDGLKLERIVGSDRVAAMVKGDGGDVFDFV